MIVGKEYIFDSAHFIAGHSRCGQIHGHTWIATVMVRGESDPRTGFLIDFHDLNDIVRPLIATIDHAILNELVHIRPLTAETLAQWLVNQLRKSELNITGRIGVRLQEGRGGWAEVWEEV